MTNTHHVYNVFSHFLFIQPEYYKDAPHFRCIDDGPQYRLEIPRAKLDYTGTYTAVASNCHGETKAIISLQICAKGKSNQLQIIELFKTKTKQNFFF